MPQIVSGLDPKVRMEAYLAGQQGQQRLVAQQEEAMANDKARREKAAERIQEAMASHKKEQAKALADANARAAMGEVQAMKQQDMEAAAQGLPPDQKRLQEYTNLRSHPNIANDPDALEELDKSFQGLEKGIQEQKRKEAVNSMVDTAIKDGLTTAEEHQARLASGEEEEQLAMEYAKGGREQRKTAVATEMNTKFVEKARALLEAMEPDSEEYAQALEAIVGLEGSATNMGNPNAGKTMFKFVQHLAIPGQRKKIREGAEGEPHEPFFFGAFGEGPMMTGGPTGPEGPIPGTHATLRGTNRKQATGAPASDPKQIVLGVLQQTQDPMEIGKLLKAQGIALTPQLQAIIRQALQGGGSGAPAE